MKPIHALAVPAGLLCLACNQPVTTYGNARKVETVNADFGSTDLQLIAETMVRSLLDSQRVEADPAQPGLPPVVAVTRIVNNTSEHIDTKSITDKIRTALVKSGKVRFSALEAQGDLLEQYRLQDALASSATAKEVGRQIGAKYILRGDLSSIVKNQGRSKDVYYKLTLNLIEVESAVIQWAEEQEIRKETLRKLIAF